MVLPILDFFAVDKGISDKKSAETVSTRYKVWGRESAMKFFDHPMLRTDNFMYLVT